MQLLPPQPPHLDPELALKIAQASQEMLRKDFYSATFVIMGAALVGMALWVIWLQVRFAGVQDRRVQDQIDGERRSELRDQRTAVHIDKNTEAMEYLAAQSGIRIRRPRKDAQALGPEPVTGGKLPTGVP